MNRKVTAITFLILLIIILIYPPFLWNSDIHMDAEVLTQLPIKRHVIIFQLSIEEFELKYYPVVASDMHKSAQTPLDVIDRFPMNDFGIVPLRRSIASLDLIIEIIIAIAFSALLGLISKRRGKKL